MGLIVSLPIQTRFFEMFVQTNTILSVEKIIFLFFVVDFFCLYFYLGVNLYSHRTNNKINDSAAIHAIRSQKVPSFNVVSFAFMHDALSFDVAFSI